MRWWEFLLAYAVFMLGVPWGIYMALRINADVVQPAAEWLGSE